MQSGRGMDRRDVAADSLSKESAETGGGKLSAVSSAARLRIIKGPSSSPPDHNSPLPVDNEESQYQRLAARQSAALSLLAHCLDQSSLEASLTALVEELHHQFHCNRVVAGLANEGEIQVASISQQSSLDRRSGEVRLLQAAMQEACDQEQVIYFNTGPVQVPDRLVIVEAHRTLSAGQRHAQLCSVPLCHQGKIIGGLLFEDCSGEAWSHEVLELQKTLSILSAQLLALRLQAEAGWWQRVRESAGRKVDSILAPRQLLAKLGVVAALAVLAIAALLPVDHHVTAAAELVSTERRLITAPVLGYVSDVHVGVGDRVEAGQPLLSLDVRDLKLQADKLRSAIIGAESEYRSAMASHDRKEMAIAQSQLEQVRSELDLVSSQIKRAQLIAPVDGIIISGDLSQKIGAPVDRGETLLEMATAQEYKIALLLGETSIGFAEVGQRGQLTLKASPADPIEFSVSDIHPVAVSAEGATRFRLDALPSQLATDLLPGQTGVARIKVGEASALWIWTHRFMDWVRLRWWGWFG